MIEKLTWNTLSELVHKCENKLRLVLPAIHEEWAFLLEECINNGLMDIKVCINNSEKYIRDGFGDDRAVVRIKQLGLEIFETVNNRISLISVDNLHHLYFPTSRTFENLLDEDTTNAVRIDDLIATQLLLSFFPSDKPNLTENLEKLVSISLNRTADMFKEAVDLLQKGKVEVVSALFDEKKFEEIHKSIEANPVQSPDLKREIEVYTTKVLFVELKFENGKINNRRVKIPPNAMPFQSVELKRILESSLRVFTSDVENEAMQGYRAIQQYVKTVRECYLKSVKCRHEISILEKRKFIAFEKEIKTINKSIEAAKSSLINDIDEQIERTQKRLCAELFPFFLTNPPPKFTPFSGDSLKEKI